MKILYCSYEVAPFYKKGGLGDVAGSLPKALKKLGVDISVVMPKYNIKNKKLKIKNTNKKFKIEFSKKEEIVGIWESVLPGSEVPIYFLENNRYLNEIKKDRAESMEQFAFFSKAIVEFTNFQHRDSRRNRHAELISASSGILKQVQNDKNGYDLIHLNDWHTALVPLLSKLQQSDQRPATFLTVHNFAHKGKAPLDFLAKLGISPEDSRALTWDISDQDLEILMQGIIHADLINTVSPTYAKEILEPETWGKLSKVLKGKEGRVKGILNSIDYDVWDPEIDPHLQINFGSDSRFKAQGSRSDIKNWQEGKRANKLALQKELGLKIDENKPLLAFIGRLAGKQKGLDILYEALIKLLSREKFQFVLLGTGSEEWEDKFRELDKRGVMKAKICFDERLAHQIYAGADFILVPSKFEPCGLIQMIAMRYGTLPIVRKTGGLADTVKDGVNGFVFEEYSDKALVQCIQRALGAYQREANYKQMIERVMKEDFSWEKRAQEYLELYKEALEIRGES